MTTIAILLAFFIVIFIACEINQAQHLEDNHRELMELLNEQATMIGEAIPQKQQPEQEQQ